MLICALQHKIGSVFMLACALGAGYLSVLKNVDSLSAEHGVVVGGSQCIGKVCLVSNPVAAVFRLSVDGVAGNAEYLLLLHKRDIVAACTIPCGHGGSDPMGAGVAGINAVVLVDQADARVPGLEVSL